MRMRARRVRSMSIGVVMHPWASESWTVHMNPIHHRAVRVIRRRREPHRTTLHRGPDTARYRAFFLSGSDRAAAPQRGRSFTICRAVAPSLDGTRSAQIADVAHGLGASLPSCSTGFDSLRPLLFGCVRAPGAHDQPRERRALCAGSEGLWCSGRTGWCTHHFPRSGTAEWDFR